MKTRTTTIVLPFSAMLFVALAASPASSAQLVAPPLPEQPNREEYGLALTIEPLNAGTSYVSDTRPVRLLALYVPAGHPASPFVAPGRFRATWTGNLNLPLRERLGFVVEGRGKITIRVKDKVVLEAEGDDLSAKAGEVVRINKGKNPLVVTYESPAAGDAFVRVAWKEQRGLRPEPSPPTTFTHNAAAGAAAQGARVRHGRQLLADLRCTKCHASDGLAGVEGSVAGMPDLAADAPALNDAGARFNVDWLAAWVADPRTFRRDSHMPRLLADATQAADVAAYLASLGAERSTPKPSAQIPQQITQGGQIFSSLMCVACHAPPDAARLADSDTRVPLGYVNAKFRPDALRRYLLRPEAHYAWNPMPTFGLSGDEAGALAAYLLDKATKTVPAPARPGKVESGRQLVRSTGCLNCHAIEAEKTSLNAPALAAIDGGRWTQGCMAPNGAARNNAPDFGLNATDRHALLAFAATDRSSLARETAMEFSLRQTATMRCTACHARDRKESAIGTDYAADAAALASAFPPPQSAGGVHDGEFFAPDQRPPPLTWAGEKLRPEWSAAFLGGQIQYKPRPYLRARMPAWPARAKLLAEGLSAEHGYGPTSPRYPAPDEQIAAAGQKLIGAAGGFSCVQCHAVGPDPATAPFEAPAPNMQHITDRLRKDYYHRWMLNPIKVDPDTKMPAFADDEAKTALREVYEGDAMKQFEAIWQFLLRGPDMTPRGGNN